ncbi:ABC transporter permease [Devosia sp. PTR5]|uniref:ABC transporter permease n=1 Tax=Devosia oryzisoli TaxID=2774138 RepID=A0A927FTW5_9HYPH|nr:ABC transporter permease [Devosia oryzisoli]MBD8066215.1 ABC transporter permease [Devosia oryzisoli]
MSQLQYFLALLAGGVSLIGLVFGLISGPLEQALLLKAFLALGTLSLVRFLVPLGFWADAALAFLGTVSVLTGIGIFSPAPAFFWLALVASWLFAWLFVERFSRVLAPGWRDSGGLGLIIPIVFGVAILVVWEAITRGANVPQVILPPPSMIGARIASSIPTLWADFQQTFLKAVLIGYLLGCGLGFVVAILIDRSPFLKSGLLPLGNLVSALPIVGVAPIMVMWFGFDWPSKAAVVVIMTFFPMLVNTVAGLNAASVIERDLMRTYAASYWQTLMKLRLPAAGPFIFNALKINSTLALIGAIVAEFFGTPIVGMGFRISTEVGRMNVDMVWAEIAVAAVAGSVFYGVITLVERRVTFWHPSVRGA